jgi:hypothetical protein
VEISFLIKENAKIFNTAGASNGSLAKQILIVQKISFLESDI